ncbi:hypothetical protein EJ05DRAFT_541367 [Pseudovirgaria hyperparasitica]|uniref:SPT2-domain-containing protein n=1 Tax=Pseudovirgaria hyperparasitica TaxID=470096 RepID=A0A6A6VVM4_9PEZI|nr:uncharacterized protein EJ05DRAFT_541367 [Pseudovirgaria hyperparasitica]KAF2754283.1 hypothetical protein EJ05DRAFT_541367 [Pseudovirgaria hyperparasitica]
MSFLNSVLSSIGTGQPASPSTAPARAPTLSSTPGSRRPLPINGVTLVQATKRKAESDIGAVATKAPRTDDQQHGAVRYTGTAKASATPPVSRPSSRPASTGPDSLPYRGTANSGPSTTNGPKSVVKSTTVVSSAPARPISRPTTPANSGLAPPAPKAGSYAAMLARAKATQSEKPVVGSITHKQTEKLTKKELLARKEEAKKQQLLSKGKSATTNGRPGKPDAKSDTAREKKKSEPSYQGTAHGKAPEPSYSGTARSGPATKSHKSAPYVKGYNGRISEKNRGPSYAYADEDEDEEESYMSDASSDMEAGAFDVDHEEQLSLRAAKKEDEEALREEAALRQAKLLRKKQMEKLAAAAAAKKKRY